MRYINSPRTRRNLVILSIGANMDMKKFLEENPLDKEELEAFMASQDEDPFESDGARDPEDYDIDPNDYYLPEHPDEW